MSNLNRTRVHKSNKIATHEGGVGRKAGAEEELTILSLSSFLSDSFYETGSETLNRMYNLVQSVPNDFALQLARVARQEFNMRATPAALVGFYTLTNGQPQDGRVINDVFFRGDEIGDYLGVVSSYSDNRKVIPSAVRFARNVLQSQLNERKALRYNNFNRDWNLAKIIRLSHARADTSEAKRALFDFILKWKSEGSLKSAWELTDETNRTLLPVISRAVNGEDNGEVSWERSRSNGASWNDVVREMGYMALLRNLRNFMEDESLVGDDDFWDYVTFTLSDEGEVANSKQLPFRFLSAYRALPTGHRRYHQVAAAISKALDFSVGNLPVFEGRTLIIVDISGSMSTPVSEKSNIHYVDIGGLFGAAMFQSQDSDVVCFGTNASKVSLSKNDSVLTNQSKVVNSQLRSRLGHGTNFHEVFNVVNANDYDNIVIFSDMQVSYHLGDLLNKYEGSVYTVNLASYEAQMTKLTRNQYEIGGWSDSTLRLMSLLSSGNLINYIRNYE